MAHQSAAGTSTFSDDSSGVSNKGASKVLGRGYRITVLISRSSDLNAVVRTHK